MIIKRKDCKKCELEKMYSQAFLMESMSHWGDPGFEEKSYSYVYGRGRMSGITDTLIAVLVISILAIIAVAISK